MGVVRVGETPSPESGVRNKNHTLRADPPPPSRQPTLPQVWSSDSSAETAMSETVRQLALLADPLSVPTLARPIGPADALAPQEAYVASLLGETMTVEMIVDVSPMSEDETLRFLARLVTSGIVRLAGVRAGSQVRT